MVLTRNDWFRNMRRNMGIYSRPLRNPLIHSRLHSSWLFSCAADGELAHRTTDNENRQEVRRTDGCMIPKGLPGPPRAAPRCRKRSAAESRPSSHRPLAKQPHIGTPYGHTKRPTSCAKGRYRAMAHRNHPHSARKRHLGAAV